MAAARPAGPPSSQSPKSKYFLKKDHPHNSTMLLFGGGPPTVTTSYSMASRGSTRGDADAMPLTRLGKALWKKIPDLANIVLVPFDNAQSPSEARAEPPLASQANSRQVRCVGIPPPSSVSLEVKKCHAPDTLGPFTVSLIV